MVMLMCIPLWIRVDPIKLIVVLSPIRTHPPSYLANIGILSTSQEFTFFYAFTGVLVYKYNRQTGTPSCIHFTVHRIAEGE